MQFKKMKAASEKLAAELAAHANGSPAYKKTLAAAKKRLGAEFSDPDEVEDILDRAEKYASDIRQDAAEGGSLARVAPMESVQDRMDRLLSENAEEDTAADNAKIERLSRKADVGLEAALNKLQGTLGKDLDALTDLLTKFGGSEGEDAEKLNKWFNDAVGAVHMLRQVVRKYVP